MNRLLKTSPQLNFRFNQRYRVDAISQCWIWTGNRYPSGYGRISVGTKYWLAHRLSWKIAGKKLHSWRKILHKCDNRACVNPDHLFSGTQGDNITDMVQKGRECFGERNGMNKLPTHSVRIIRLLKKYCDFTNEEIAKFFGVSTGCVLNINANFRWKRLKWPFPPGLRKFEND